MRGTRGTHLFTPQEILTKGMLAVIFGMWQHVLHHKLLQALRNSVAYSTYITSNTSEHITICIGIPPKPVCVHVLKVQAMQQVWQAEQGSRRLRSTLSVAAVLFRRAVVAEAKR